MEFLYARLQGMGNWMYEFCGAHQNELAAGIACLTLALVALCAARTRKFFNPAAWALLGSGIAFLAEIALLNGYFRTGVSLYAACAAIVCCYCALVRGQYGLEEIEIGKEATVAVMIVVVACAAFMRFYLLGDYPAGFNNDEALFSYYGLLTMRGEPLRGWWAGPSQYLVAHLYSLAAIFKVFGASIASARSASGVIGILSVVACFLMADQLFKRAVALLAASSLALCFCCAGFDRLAIPLNWGTPFACMGVYFLLLAESRGKQSYGFLSGFFLGFGIWTYDVYKGVLLALAVFIFFRVIFSRGYFKNNWLALVLLAAGFIAATGPLLKGQGAHTLGYMDNIFLFVGKPNLPQSVTPGNLLLGNIQMFGRTLFRVMSESVHLTREGPIINGALVPLFFMGFVCALYNWKRYNYFLMLVWFLLSPIGGILSWPCTRRIIIFMPALHILVALGALLLFRALQRAIGFNRSRGFFACLAFLIFVLFAVNTHIYFSRSRIFTGNDLKQMGECVDGQIGKRYVYLVDVSSYRYSPEAYVMSYESRKGEDSKKDFDFIDGKHICDRILNSPPRDMVFVLWNNRKMPETMQGIESIERNIPHTEVERKEYIVTCAVSQNDLAKWRGGTVSYTDCGEAPGDVWGSARTESLDFDWRAHPLPYPFRIGLKAFFYVPKEGGYGFQAMGNGETELFVDGEKISLSAAPEHYLGEGAHEVSVKHVQNEPGSLGIRWGADAKSMEPLYVWSDAIQRVCGSAVDRSGEIVMVDDGDKGFSIVSGSWGERPSNTAFGGSSRRNERGDGGHTAKWSFTAPRDGYCEVYAIWEKADDHATDAPYRILHAEGEELRRVDQKKGGGSWMSLGTYPFLNGDEYEITLSDDANGNVDADAVKIEYRREIQ
ncbi:MAG: glycosyltransferase family 39 protein [Chlamydiota bacterium]